ncbi:MAG: 4-(cytidine 5'-diphospho)-2-C-methyl-D-erythritol kinase [Acetobacteraceae bacterium]|nr:4-(cytidine 5'-diphospho)-2-C-methyl-D-erythritol kinase [Acetobacteraceae bacterium]
MAADLHEPAPAKVNLFLHVTGKRADGYHLLDSLAVFAGLADHLTFAPSDALFLRVTGPFAGSLPSESDNLVLRAARLLATECGAQPNGALTLDKRIPVASGVGGGSADAAAVLRLLCRAWGVTPTFAVLDRVATSLGADIPVCLRNRPMRMGGVGERLTPAPSIPECGLALVNPGIPLATVSVFRAWAGGFSSEAILPNGWDNAAAMAASLSGLRNDLEAPAVVLVPAIQQVLCAIRETPGCLLARMSGSGATCFGLFASTAAAQAAAAQLTRPGWWAWGGPLSR